MPMPGTDAIIKTKCNNKNRSNRRNRDSGRFRKNARDQADMITGAGEDETLQQRHESLLIFPVVT